MDEMGYSSSWSSLLAALLSKDNCIPADVVRAFSVRLDVIGCGGRKCVRVGSELGEMSFFGNIETREQ